MDKVIHEPNNEPIHTDFVTCQSYHGFLRHNLLFVFEISRPRPLPILRKVASLLTIFMVNVAQTQ